MSACTVSTCVGHRVAAQFSNTKSWPIPCRLCGRLRVATPACGCEPPTVAAAVKRGIVATAITSQREEPGSLFFSKHEAGLKGSETRLRLKPTGCLQGP
jgi:hypothetical protein